MKLIRVHAKEIALSVEIIQGREERYGKMEQGGQYRVCAVIATYNRLEMLKEELEMIDRQAFAVERIVLVDSSANDDTSCWISGRYKEDKRMIYCKNDQVSEPCAHFRKGMKLALETGCDFLWLMDDDGIPYPGTLKGLMDAAAFLDSRSQRFSYLSPVVHGKNNVMMNTPGISGQVDENSGYQDWCKYLKQGLVKLDSATAVSLLIRRSAVVKCGLPTEAMRMWVWDTEYTKRLSSHDAPGFCVGDSLVFHKRKLAKALNIAQETDPERIRAFKYMYLNNPILTRTYSGRIRAGKQALKQLRGGVAMLLKSPAEQDRMKAKVIISGSLAYLFGRYDKEKYAKRFHLDMEPYREGGA